MKQILVVEDESIIARDLQKNLQRLGYEVPAIAFSSEDALQAVSHHLPDLVLMDINLGAGGDGIETAKTMRDQFNIPVVFLTAYADQNTLQRAKLTQPFGYLIKPFEERELLTTIEMALHNHEMERRLKESEEWLRATIHSMGDAVIATDQDGLVKFMNPVAETLTGWHNAEACGRRITEVFQLLNETSRTVASNPVLAALAKEQVVTLAEPTLLITRDGREIPINDSASPIRDHLENVSGAVLIFQDITVRRALEAQLNQSQKMEAVGRLAGGVAHDFNNMMTAVIGYSELLLLQVAADSPFHIPIKEIKMAGERAAALTRQLLAFSRKQILQPVDLNLNETIDHMLRMLRRLINEDIAITPNLSKDLGSIKIDPTQIEQVILNLAINARDAMPGGGKLMIETTNITLDEAYAEHHPNITPGDYVRLAISDTGYGMNQETRSHIFEPFFTTKASGKGTGLGLSMVYGIVKQSGGDIQVNTEPGKGSSFQIYFQRSQTSEIERVEQVEETEFPTGTEVILVVEDEETVRQMIRRTLVLNGYQILTASNGLDALAIFEAHQEIDLVISDIIMPEMNGRELSERLKRLRPDLKILFMSGYTDDVTMHHKIENAATGFIQKPFTIEALGQKVRAVLDNPA